MTLRFPASPDDRPEPHGLRGGIAVRWTVWGDGVFRLGWPTPGGEQHARAIGWTVMGRPFGVIAFARGGVHAGLLDTLDAAFPGLRWFEGAWESEAAFTRAA